MTSGWVNATLANVPLPVLDEMAFFPGDMTQGSVSLGETRRVVVHASAALGTQGARADRLALDICYQPVAGGALVHLGAVDIMDELTVAGPGRTVFTLSDSGFLPAGNYRVGMCYQVRDTRWDNNAFTRVIVQVMPN